jgi:hypothetical protein
METIGNVLVSFHGRGKLKQVTSSPDLPHTPIFPDNPVLAPHHVGRSLPWPDASMGMEPRAPLKRWKGKDEVRVRFNYLT